MNSASITSFAGSCETPAPSHAAASLYEAFAPEEARRLARRLEIHFTPKRLLAQRRRARTERADGPVLGSAHPALGEVDRERRAWAARRNERQVGVNWHFTADDARVRLKRLYPKILE